MSRCPVSQRLTAAGRARGFLLLTLGMRSCHLPLMLQSSFTSSIHRPLPRLTFMAAAGVHLCSPVSIRLMVLAAVVVVHLDGQQVSIMTILKQEKNGSLFKLLCSQGGTHTHTHSCTHTLTPPPHTPPSQSFHNHHLCSPPPPPCPPPPPPHCG